MNLQDYGSWGMQIDMDSGELYYNGQNYGYDIGAAQQAAQADGWTSPSTYQGQTTGGSSSVVSGIDGQGTTGGTNVGVGTPTTGTNTGSNIDVNSIIDPGAQPFDPTGPYNQNFNAAASGVSRPYSNLPVNTALTQQGVTGSLSQSETGSASQANTQQDSTQQTNQTSGQATTSQNVQDTSQQQTQNTVQQNTQFNNQATNSTNVSNLNQNVASTGTETTDQVARNQQNEFATSRRTIDDAGGFVNMLAGTAQGDVDTLNARNLLLQDFASGPDAGFNYRLEQGINQALSGPGAARAGESAKDRVASRAAAEVANNSIQNQINAAGLIDAGASSGVANAANAARGFSGETNVTRGSTAGINALTGTTASNQNQATTGTQTDVGSQNTSGVQVGSQTGQMTGNTTGQTVNTGAQNTTGFQDTTQTGSQTTQANTQAAERSSGFTIGEILGTSFGTQPEGGGGGGTVICTVYRDFGYLNDKVWEADRRMGKRLNPTIMAGYYFWGVPLAKWLRRKGPNSLVVKTLAPFVQSWAQYIGSKMFVEIPPSRLGAVMYHLGLPICKLIGSVLVSEHTRTERRVA